MLLNTFVLVETEYFYTVLHHCIRYKIYITHTYVRNTMCADLNLTKNDWVRRE